MKRTLTFLTILGIYTCAFGQLITKKESKQINQLLDELSKNLYPSSYIIRNVTVITMKDSLILPFHDVWVENGLIRQIGSDIHADTAILEIDGNDKYLLPGLIDMHAHLFVAHPMTNTWKIHFLLNGVTSIQDMNGVMGTEKLKLRDDINDNKVFAPTIYQASQLIDSRKGPFFKQAITPTDGQRLVKEMKQEGFDFIKVYDGLTADVYQAIIAESQSLKIPVVGHIPLAITLTEALQAKQNSIEHLTGFFDWKGSTIQLTAPRDYAKLTSLSETWVCPTLFNHQLNLSRVAAQTVLNDSAASLLPKGLYENWLKRSKDESSLVIEMVDKNGSASFDVLKQIVQSLYYANAKLIAGTDAGNLPFLIPGNSLIEELKLLSRIGISNYDVLSMATSNAARAMGKQTSLGTIEEGKRADFILLTGNPLEDINNVYTNKGVMVRGVWISESERIKIVRAIHKIFNR